MVDFRPPRFIHTKRFDSLNNGFTLIELLVGIVLAGLVVTPLMSFMMNVLATERQEEAKTTSEQEIQSALNYITQDLAQAVYIYDADGLNSTSNSNPPGIKDQIPPLATAPGCEPTNCTPVLVFWKREFKPEVISQCSGDSGYCSEQGTLSDAYVYSLVAYYSITENANTARIARFQISDGVKQPETDEYVETPDDGFQLFSLRVAGRTIKEKMNRWQKTEQRYTTSVDTLVDFIDQSNINHQATCPANTQQVPSTAVGGFSACVDSLNTTARVDLRGNAGARIGNNTTCDRTSTYCPTVSAQVQGRSLTNN